MDDLKNSNVKKIKGSYRSEFNGLVKMIVDLKYCTPDVVNSIHESKDEFYDLVNKIIIEKSKKHFNGNLEINNPYVDYKLGCSVIWLGYFPSLLRVDRYFFMHFDWFWYTNFEKYFYNLEKREAITRVHSSRGVFNPFGIKEDAQTGIFYLNLEEVMRFMVRPKYPEFKSEYEMVVENVVNKFDSFLLELFNEMLELDNTYLETKINKYCKKK